MSLAARLVGLALGLALSACAGIDVHRLSSWDPDDSGFRYYMPEPYLQVSSSQPSSVRIDFVKNDAVALQSDGTPRDLVLGKVHGLSNEAAITLVISDNSKVAFVSRDPIDDKKTSVVPSNGVVRVPVRFAGAVGEGATHQFKVSAWFGNHDLGSGVYVAKPTATGTDVVSQGNPDAKPPGYELRIVYLPNPYRILAVDHGEGIGGNAEVALQLKDGWMLTQVNSKSDTQSDENITAVAGLVEAIGSAAAGVMKPAGAAIVGPPPQVETDPTGLYRPDYDEATGGIRQWIKVPFCMQNCEADQGGSANQAGDRLEDEAKKDAEPPPKK
jgi:hypothetical protein